MRLWWWTRPVRLADAKCTNYSGWPPSATRGRFFPAIRGSMEPWRLRTRCSPSNGIQASSRLNCTEFVGRTRPWLATRAKRTSIGQYRKAVEAAAAGKLAGIIQTPRPDGRGCVLWLENRLTNSRMNTSGWRSKRLPPWSCHRRGPKSSCPIRGCETL